jgi:hypothetical protein
MQKCARVHQAWAAPLGAVFPGFFLGTLQLSVGESLWGLCVVSFFAGVPCFSRDCRVFF